MTSIALITGANGGIGRALARQLHTQGLGVAVVGRDADRLADVDAVLRIAADTTTPEGAALAIAACQTALGAAPTLLAHCVGSTLIAPLHRTRTDAYREVIRVNLDSAVFMLQAWIAALKGERGAAVFASSVVARIGVASHEVIAAAQGLRVNAVTPGMTDTPMTAGMLKMPAMREGAARQYPLGGGADGRAGGRRHGLTARHRRGPRDGAGNCGGRRLHHRAAPIEVTANGLETIAGSCE
jgi:NAD(P)-dependent dehydrogenase (short-subunit alcohol dehydrogenase family)